MVLGTMSMEAELEHLRISGSVSLSSCWSAELTYISPISSPNIMETTALKAVKHQHKKMEVCTCSRWNEAQRV